MASSPSSQSALTAYIDIPFNIYLLLILTLTYILTTTHNYTLLLLAVLTTSLIILTLDTTSTFIQTIKIIALLPLGLGSVLTFLITSRSFQTRWLSVFTRYINFAVYGNVVMMLGTPIDGTLRGICSKFACVMLFGWLVLLGRRVGWETLTLYPHQSGEYQFKKDQSKKQLSEEKHHSKNTTEPQFIFTAVTPSWIIAHAIYRSILLTLPTFGWGRRHRLMEVYSLGMTWVLARSENVRFEWGFGLADTLVVPVMAGWSALATLFGVAKKDEKMMGSMIGEVGDWWLSVLLLGVAGFAGWKIVSLLRDGDGDRKRVVKR